MDRASLGRESLADAGVEILLVSGERLRVGVGVDAATLRVALEALRG